MKSPTTKPLYFALDLESVLVPEIWETIAQSTGIISLSQTTRDQPDYSELMSQRIRLCRENGLTLVQLRKIVSTMEPLPDAITFIQWTLSHGKTIIVSDTFHELADPLLEKLGSIPILCNALQIDEEGYIQNFQFRHPLGKQEAITTLQSQGYHVISIGDSFNDFSMLQQADTAFLLNPSKIILSSNRGTEVVYSFSEIQEKLKKTL
ncbi:MAG: bifunctional phosphoserine phosphatase/homoserine phosphotransferase ThrH [Verrucomicrobiota bacterium]